MNTPRSRPRNLCPILSNSAGDGIGRPRCWVMKRHHLPAGLQDRHVRVQVDPVQALDIQHHMPAQHLIDRHHASAHASLHDPSLTVSMSQRAAVTDQPA
jgi:hypothetical protein